LYKPDDLQILSINISNPDWRIKPYIRRYQMRFPVLRGKDSDVSKQYGIRGLPRLVIIDSSGKIAFYGRALKDKNIKQIVDPLLMRMKRTEP
jgi:hypothetical protein